MSNYSLFCILNTFNFFFLKHQILYSDRFVQDTQTPERGQELQNIESTVYRRITIGAKKTIKTLQIKTM